MKMNSFLENLEAHLHHRFFCRLNQEFQPAGSFEKSLPIPSLKKKL